jgi:hypothetical protein
MDFYYGDEQDYFNGQQFSCVWVYEEDGELFVEDNGGGVQKFGKPTKANIRDAIKFAKAVEKEWKR